LADGEYKEIRPRRDGKGLARMFTKIIPNTSETPIRILDYGGGTGVMAQVIRTECSRPIIIEVYDPFEPEFATRPTGLFDIIYAIEVLEHTPNPQKTFEEMNSLRKDEGIILATTLVVPQDVSMDWWYIAPRNGHCSLYNRKSLFRMAKKHHLKYGKYKSLHIFLSENTNSHNTIVKNMLAIRKGFTKRVKIYETEEGINAGKVKKRFRLF
jgi:SAM-dependent methyltransferase